MTPQELAAELEELKKKRRHAKAVVTRQRNLLNQYVIEELHADTKETLQKLLEAFRNFSKVHDSYHYKLTNEDDMDASDTYFAEVQRDYVETFKLARDWLKSLDFSKPDDASAKPESPPVKDKRFTELLSLINMPKVDFEKFSGDPLNDHTFKAMFEESVKAIDDKSIKLNRLLQCTAGKANDAIRACALMKGDDGYDQASKVLEDRFGNSYLVCERLIQSICNGKHLKSPEDLVSFADELNHCQMILKSMGRLQEIESQRCIVETSDRLQNYLRTRWRRKAMEIKDTRERYPCFFEFVEFVNKEARDASDPVYGNYNSKSQGHNYVGKSKSTASFSSGASRVERRSLKCVLCSDDHKLFLCQSFKSMKPPQRLPVAESKGLCLNCLLANHITNDCRRPPACKVSGCGKRHSTYLHINNHGGNGSSGLNSNPSSSNVELVNANVSVDTKVHMPVVGVKVNDKMDVCALLDTGSSNTFCTRFLVESLGVEGREVAYSLNTLSSSAQEVQSRSVNLHLSSLDGSNVLNVYNVYVVDSFPVKSTCPNVKEFSHFAGLQFVAANQDVHLLIGQDNCEALVPLQVKSGNASEPFASRTIFGWSVNGPSRSQGKISKGVMSQFISSVEMSLEDKVEKLWALENDFAETRLSLSQDDRKVLDLWERNLMLTNGHYELPIPLKDNAHFPNNFSMAVRRFESLQSLLRRRGLMDRYKLEMDKLFQSGYAEVVPLEEIDNSEDIWYLPHQAVVSDKKPDKVRIVFDCAAKYRGESLNDKCLQGPDENNRLVHVLVRFREHDYAMTADIESMYYQVRIPVTQRNVLRFLWFDDNGRLIHCRMTCHVFGGIWCSSSTTYALRQTLKDFEASSSVANAVMHSFYVDDCLQSVPSPEEAVEVASGVKSLIGNAGFNLTKFVFNDCELLQIIPPEDRAKEVKDFNSEACSKVLGIQWKVDPDEFRFQVNVDLEMSVTRRSMLSTIASTYDPLGLISPLIVQGKILFQEATRLKLSWDKAVPPDLRSKWIYWLKALSEVVHVGIPRCVKPAGFNDAALEIHHFSDASERAYGCVSYLRCANKTGDLFVSLLFSKSKVTPLKTVSIPRLELQAAVMSTQVDVMLRSELDLDVLESTFWVDSELVLKYISNETRRFKVYVGNRVSAIRAVSDPHQWHHVSGTENPADMVSRGGDTQTLDMDVWLHGPNFLRTHRSTWQVPVHDFSLPSDDPEIKREASSVQSASFVTQVVEHPLDQLISHYSSWFRLKKAVAWLLRLKAILRKVPHAQGRILSVSDVDNAEVVLLRHVQSQSYSDELVHLGKHDKVGKSSSLKQLSPFLDKDGIIRVGGRLERISVDGVCKHPIVVPHNHKVAFLIAEHFHGLAHLGTEWIVSLMRRKFWITRIRLVVKRVGKGCVTCRRLFAAPCEQMMANLPVDRVEPNNPPFTSVGVDCFGPFMVKLGRSEVKRYGCLYTCMATRAIHLEKLNSMDTDSYVNSLRRFICRRGQPSKLFSDNGTNFVGGKSVLEQSLRQLDSEKISQFCLKEGIEWCFNPPMASHMGGTWERMIRTVRKVMSGVLNIGCRLTDEILETLFCEVEAIVNSRPITKASEDLNDPAPLTPSHLLLLRGSPVMPVGVFHEADLYKRRWRVVQFLADQFWRRWLREYVPELQRRNKWHNPQANLSVGDLVLLSDENTPRGVWPMGLIICVKESEDGLVRSVVVKTKSSQFTRPISKCVLLEGCKEF